MQGKFDLKKFEKVIFFIMMWVFFSLNSRYLKIPFPHILRWVFLGILVGCVLLFEKVRIGAPPKLLYFFVAAVVPSIIYSNDRVESVTKILSLVIVMWGVYSYFQTLKTPEEKESAIKNILCIIILFEIQSLGCLMLGLGRGDRATGVTTNPNTLGIYSNLSLLAGAYFLSNAKTKGNKCFYLLIIIASMVTAIMSGSRTAIVTLFLNVVVCSFIFIKSKLNRFVFSILVLVFVVLFFSGVLGDFGLKPLRKILDGETDRGEIWDLGVNVWKRFPIFGCGYSVSASYNNLVGMENYDFHNSYITILAEIGIWGCVLLVIGMCLSFYGIFRKKIEHGKMSILVTVLIMLVELLIAAWSESFMFAVGSTEACLFWVLVVWVISYKNTYEKKKKQKEKLNGK